MDVSPGKTSVPGAGDWPQYPGEPTTTFVEKQFVASAQRSGTTPKQLVTCRAGKLATQLQSTTGFAPAMMTEVASARPNNAELIGFFIGALERVQGAGRSSTAKRVIQRT